MGLDFDFKISGPIADGRMEQAIVVGLAEAEDQIAQQGVNDVRRILHGVLRHPTGRYESRVHTERAGSDRVITDGDIVYGPWLEGVSTRNRTTRFKGYATFRRAAALLNQQAGPIAERVISEKIGRL